LLPFGSESLVFPLLSRNVKVNIYKTITVSCFVWMSSLTLREEHGLRVFENRVLRRISGPERDEVIGEWRSCTMRNFIFRTHSQILLGRSNQGE
jgi:hypothetical protein